MPKMMSVSFISEVDKGNESCYRWLRRLKNLGCRFILGSRSFINFLFSKSMLRNSALKVENLRIEVGKVVCQLHAKLACHEILERALV
jgi:hypothetical protein